MIPKHKLPVEEGDTLTIDHDVINDEGKITMFKGDKVIVDSISTFGQDELVIGIRVEGRHGCYFLSTFAETKHLDDDNL